MKYILALFLCIFSTMLAMKKEPDVLEGFEIIPSPQAAQQADQEAQQEQQAIDLAIKEVPASQKEQTAWQSFMNQIANIPRGIGYVGQVLGVLSTTRLYLDSTLETVLQEEEAKISPAEKQTFKDVRNQVNQITDRFEQRLQNEAYSIQDPQKRQDAIQTIKDIYLSDLHFITRLEQAGPFGKLSRSALELLMLTFLKDVRVTLLQPGPSGPLFATWSAFVTDFTAELMNTRQKRVDGKQVPRNPHKREGAQVTPRERGAISDDEKNIFLPARDLIALKAQRRLLEPLVTGPLQLPPVTQKTGLRIGLVFSGGGYRAMTLTAGYLEALEQLGILNAATYISTLSGSTWYVAPWIKSGLPIAIFNQDLAERMPFMNVEFLGRIAFDEPQRKEALHRDILLPKFAFNQPIGTVDLYGWLLAQTLLEGDYTAVLSEQWDLIKDGNYPFPLYTTISMHNIGTQETPNYRYQWYEANPLEFENIEQGLSIPVWSLGREFIKGVSIKTKGLPVYPFEQTLGFMLGIFGSAYTIDFLKEGHKFVKGAAGWLLSAVQKVVTIKRLWPAQVFNPWKDYPGQPEWLQKKKLLTFIDAGIDFNLPLPPLLKKERELDVIIIGDASSDLDKRIRVNGQEFPEEFGKFLQYLDPAGLKYEPFEGYTEQPFIVYQPREAANELPILVYINYVKNENVVASKAQEDPALRQLATLIGGDFDPIVCEQQDFCATFNFKYNTQQFNQLKAMGQFNVLAYKYEILKALERKFTIKSRQVSTDADLFIMAAYKGNLELVKHYVTQELDLNVRIAGVPGVFADDAITPLMVAVYKGHDAVADYLLERGAQVDVPSKKGMTPLEVAVLVGKPETVEVLLAYNPTISDPVVRLAAQKPTIKSLLEQKLQETQLQRSLTGLQQKLDALRTVLQAPPGLLYLGDEPLVEKHD